MSGFYEWIFHVHTILKWISVAVQVILVFPQLILHSCMLKLVNSLGLSLHQIQHFLVKHMNKLNGAPQFN